MDLEHGRGKRSARPLNAGTAARALRAIRRSISHAPRKLRRFTLWLLAASVLLIGVVSILKKAAVKRDEAARKAEIEAGPRVQVAQVTNSPGEHMLTLIGETRPYQEATLYAKVSGYLKDIRVDKGDEVKKGQVLAVIESPETDQAYEAARADARNKRAIAARVRELLRSSSFRRKKEIKPRPMPTCRRPTCALKRS